MRTRHVARVGVAVGGLIGVYVIAFSQTGLDTQRQQQPKSDHPSLHLGSELPLEVIEAGDRVVVFPGEVLFLLTDVPHDSGYAPWAPDTPGAELVSLGDSFVSHWQAYGGEVLALDDLTVVYRAPSEPGVALLVWDDGSSPPIVLTVVVPGEGVFWEQEVSLPREVLRGSEGCYLPATGGQAFRLFAEMPHLPGPDNPRTGLGFTYVPSDQPLNPPPSSLDCNPEGSRSVFPRDKYFVVPPEWRNGPRKRVTAELSLKLLGFGVEVSAGEEFDIQLCLERTRLVKNADFYECRNGQLVFCGNKTSTWFVTRVIATIPPWVCKAWPNLCAVQRSEVQSWSSGCAR